jgi:hypothetical protein
VREITIEEGRRIGIRIRVQERAGISLKRQFPPNLGEQRQCDQVDWMIEKKDPSPEVYILQISRYPGGVKIFVPRVKLGKNILTLVIFRKFWWFFENFDDFYSFLRKL